MTNIEIELEAIERHFKKLQSLYRAGDHHLMHMRCDYIIQSAQILKRALSQQGVPSFKEEKWIRERDTQTLPTKELEPITPGIYECVLPFKNEMNYQWKQGEKVEVLRYSAQYHTVMCKLPGEAQEFEMNADCLINDFKKKV